MEGLEKYVNGRYFLIPENQRGYCWEDRHLEDLMNDLRLAGSNAHYLGSLIISSDKDGYFEDDRSTPTIKCILEDGQQRLTAFFFLLRAAQLRLHELNEGKDNIESGTIWNLIAYKQGVWKLRLQNSNPDLNACFSNLMVDSPPMPARKTSPMRTMERTRDWATLWFANLDEQECLLWKNRLVNKARFISVDLASEGVDRYLAFDAINSRGLPLSQFDKIKNFCMLVQQARALTIKPEKLWYDAIHQLEEYSVGSRANEEDFINESYGVFHNDRTQALKTHERFVKKYRKLAAGADGTLEASFAHFIGTWKPYAESFGFLTTNDRATYYGRLCTRDAGRWLDRLDNLGLPTITRPILVAGHIVYSKAEFETLVRACEIYTFRVYGIGEYRKGKNQTQIFALAHEILINRKSLGTALTTICMWLKKLAPLENLVANLVDQRPKYSFAPSGWPYSYYFLYEYEVHVSPRGVSPLPYATNPDEKNNSHEHILPQAHRDGSWWESHWPDEAAANKYVHRIGNLVLTSGNSTLGRKPFDKKLNDSSARYFFNCKDATNSEKLIDKYTAGKTWRQKEILKREFEMLKFAIERWAIPCCSDIGNADLPKEFDDHLDTPHISISYSQCVDTIADEEPDDEMIDSED